MPQFLTAHFAFRCAVVVLGGGLLIFCAGCELVPLATMSSVFGMAGTAVTTGSEVYKSGKLNIAFMANSATVQEAVREAAKDLHFRMIRGKSSQDMETWKVELEDNLQAKFEVTVERRTAMLCLCQVDVGLFGSEPLARVIMARIRAHLPSTAAAPPA